MEKHIHKHILRHGCKIHKHVHHTHHYLSHIGEIILVLLLGFMGLMFANTSSLQNNTSFGYPLQKVSTLECRTLYRNDMPESCKINLPKIYGGNYERYKEDELYRSIYTTLWAAPYSDSWNQKIGAHAGVDIATARGTPLYSIGDGEIYSAGWNSAYGNLVRIKYIYNGEIVYAVYAHMDSIIVKAGDSVVRGQKIGTVGNSGNTFGKLGGYHVHFEIAKDSFGRPAYSYANCPDLSKGHYKIIQNGLCRNELITYQYDPIRIFESNSHASPNPNKNNEEESYEEENNIEEEVGFEAEKDIDNKENGNKDIDNNVSNNQSKNEVDKWNEIIKEKNPNNDLNTDTNFNNNFSDKEDVKDTLEEVDMIVDVDHKEDPFLIDLDLSGLKYLAEHFSRLRDIEIRSRLREESIMLGETVTLDVEIFKKGNQLNKTGNYYNGVLQVPLIFLPNNDNISINIKSLQLVTKGKAKVEVTGDKVGKSFLIIKLDDQKIGFLDVVVK